MKCCQMSSNTTINTGVGDSDLKTGEKSPVFFSNNEHVYDMKSMLSVCIIAKNEASVITKCLDSVKFLADEIILLDTGSTDGTPDIVTKWYIDNGFRDKFELLLVGNKFHDEDGDFHFGNAKTEAIQEASCEYVMWLDASDIVEKPVQLRKIFEIETNKHKDIYFTAITKLRNISFTRKRIFPKEGSRFINPIHEDVVFDNKLSEVRTNIPIRHIDEENPSNAIKRNLRILTKEWKKNPTARTAFYLGNTYADMGKYTMAIQFYKARIEKFELYGFQEETFKALENICACYSFLYSKNRTGLHELLAFSNDLIDMGENRREGYYFRGKAYLYMGNKKEASVNFRKCLRIDKQDSLFWINEEIYTDSHIMKWIGKCK